MENNILSNKKILEIVNTFPNNFSQIFRAKRNPASYKHTFSYVNTTYTGTKFSEKLYKHIYGERHCKKCGLLLTSKQFRSFFDGYNEEFCSKQCALHSDVRTNNIKQTKLKKYGDSSFNNLPKQQETMLVKYGVKHNWNKNSPVREKCYTTNLKLHGSRTWNNPEQYRKTMITRYGAPHPSQVDQFINKIQKHKWKKYIFPSGKEIKIQGYENFALDFLLKTISELDIITERKSMPKILWVDSENTTHRYYPDIFLPLQNKFIEVKSPWIWKLHKNLNLQKINAVKSYGFMIDVLLFNQNGKLIETYAS